MMVIVPGYFVKFFFPKDAIILREKRQINRSFLALNIFLNFYLLSASKENKTARGLTLQSNSDLPSIFSFFLVSQN